MPNPAEQQMESKFTGFRKTKQLPESIHSSANADAGEAEPAFFWGGEGVQHKSCTSLTYQPQNSKKIPLQHSPTSKHLSVNKVRQRTTLLRSSGFNDSVKILRKDSTIKRKTEFP